MNTLKEVIEFLSQDKYIIDDNYTEEEEYSFENAIREGDDFTFDGRKITIEDEFRSDSGDHDSYYIIFSIEGVDGFFQITGYYCSHNGVDFYDMFGTMCKVEKKQVMVTKWVEV